MLTKTETTN